MAPKGEMPYIHQIDRTPEYEEFIRKLVAFHERRGTNFDAEPRLPTKYGHVNVDLLKLYKIVIEKGGYDEVTKVQKAWGNLAEELGMYAEDNKNMGQLSFQLKQHFYKDLAAYWIQDQYNKDPPPVEILENLTCASRYGPLLTRTLESVKLPAKTGAETPVKDERAQSESTPVSGTRASGRLREAPAQRIPFQPETGPSRQVRHSSSQHGTPTANSLHGSHGSHGQANQHHMSQQHNPNNPLHIVQAQQAALRGASSSYVPVNTDSASRLGEAFEPRPPIVVPLRPVHTPGNNPIEFAKRQRQLKMMASGMQEPQIPIKPTMPGAGFDGPNIYTRCLQALRSGIPAEQSFALNHLVKISFERGDKYKFESFLGLAEGLIEKALEIGSLFYEIDWQVAYIGFSDDSDISILDGLDGTDDILERIAKLKPRKVLDHLQPADHSDKLARVTEAVLTIRNMVMLQENAIYMAEVYPLKDLLCIILNLPNLEMLVEVKHFALDIAEQLTPYLVLDSEDPFYQSLLLQLDSTDRGSILTSLRAISRISMNLEATNKLQDVPPAVLRNIMNWLLLNDEELMDACLDFLYQYTAVVINVDTLLKAVDMEHVVPHLVRLLAHGAKRVREERVLEAELKARASEDVLALPEDLQEKLATTDEPQRCFQWLQTLFEEDSEAHITQIAIWQAYQSSFGGLQGRNLLTAADFIRNVSHVFTNARAQIIRGPGEAQRFIIEGIRARSVPYNVDTKEEYSRCLWVKDKGTTFAKACGICFLTGEQMWNHILADHLSQTKDEGQFKEEDLVASCNWQDCRKYPQPTPISLYSLAGHISTHVPSSRKRSASESGGIETPAKRARKNYIRPAKTMSLAWENTLVTRDERNPKIEQAAGIPLSAVLVLRNIARNVVKTDSEEALLKKHEMGGEGGGYNEKLFRPVKPRLFEVMTENRALAGYITSLLQLVEDD